MLKNSFNINRGHTLIELMVTLAIISVLVFVAIPLFTNYSDESKVDELKAVILRGAASQEKYFAANGNYAASLNNLTNYNFPALVEGSNVLVENSKMKLNTGIIIRSGTGVSFFVNGSYDIGKADRECWVFVGSPVGDTEFIEILPSDPIPFSGVNCN